MIYNKKILYHYILSLSFNRIIYNNKNKNKKKIKSKKHNTKSHQPNIDTKNCQVEMHPKKKKKILPKGRKKLRGSNHLYV